MSKLNANSIEVGSLTTAQRDALSAASGTVIYNSSTTQIEAYGPGGWWPLGYVGPFGATGGTTSTTQRSGYTVHTFTSPGTFTVTSGSKTAEYLIIGGGGGGGNDRPGNVQSGGGGGAGGYLSGTTTISTGSYPVTIGGGGAGGNNLGANGNPGSPTTWGSLTAVGGGEGGSTSPASGSPGGSGGGGGVSGQGGSGTVGQGNDGGTGTPGGFGVCGGGGGGAGGAGQSGPAPRQQQGVYCAGGPGSASSINGTSTTRAIGGNSPSVQAAPGNRSANTGDGGGNQWPAWNGGSGLVIIAYEN